VEEFAAFVRETGYSAGNSCWQPQAVVELRKLEWRLLIGSTWEHPGFPQTERHPVICVSWDDAKAYVTWLSAKAKRPYRLPTEAEREYAARAGSSTARFWGDGRDDACRYANVSGLTKKKAAKYTPAGKFPPSGGDYYFSCEDRFRAGSPVGSFEPNAFGLCDMLGNVDQWVEDCWTLGYEGAPGDGSA